MSSKILTVLFLFLIAGILLYVFQSGIVGSSLQSLKPVSFNNGPSTGSSPGVSYLNSGSSGNNNYSGNPGTTNNISNATGTVSVPAINPADIPPGFSASQLSPRFHQIRFGGVSYGGYGYFGQITLNAYNLPASTTVDITGWQIKSKRGGEYIPQAVNVYDPSGLTPASDIAMHANDTVSLYSSPGPFNLRLNQCIGYIGQANHTIPALPSNCPYPDRSAVQNFTGACQNYVNSIGGCSQPNLSDPRIPFNDYSCRNFLANNFTYRSCFDAHIGDADFLSNQIWVWTGSNVVDQYHDQVQLLDKNGLVVDVYSY